MRTLDVSEKIAVVTGGGRGIGRGIALVLAHNGADVAVPDINLNDAQQVAHEIGDTGRQSLATHLDVTVQQSVDAMVESTIERFGRIDILVSNAGVIGAQGWEERDETTLDDWDVTYEVNVKGMVRVIEAVTPHMKKRRHGKIVNIASIAGRQGTLTSVPYAASKAAVINLTRSLTLKLAPFDINVNAICPGLLWTPMWMRIADHFTTTDESYEGLSPREAFDIGVKTRIPLGREQTPEDIGNVTAFLASDLARNITGQSINVSGGSHLD